MLLYSDRLSTFITANARIGSKAAQKTLSALLRKHPKCTVIDWSPGRLACISTLGVDVETLAEIIRHVAEIAWDERTTLIDASYENMGSA